MAVIRMVRRKIYKPILSVIFTGLAWYSFVFMLEGNLEKQNDEITELDKKLQRSIYVSTKEKEKPLQPPDDDQLKEKVPEPPKWNDLEKVNDENHFVNEKEINDIPVKHSEPKLVELHNAKHKKPEETAENNNENVQNQQIHPPLRKFPKVDVVIKGLGENGEAVNISRDLLSEDEKKEYDDGWKGNAFNEFLSKRISLDRTLPDPRDDKCKIIKYSDDLPETSVIITFHNEAWTVLLRSVHSILNRTPAKLLKEIILVDDFSDRPQLGKPLERYIASIPKVKIVRNQKREGLIRTRLAGYQVAVGAVLVFLDSHIECAEGWLEPMLDRIKQDSTTVVTPVIDVIEDNTFKFIYQDARGTNVGGFDWNLIFTWHPVPEDERKRRQYQDHLPVRSPTMAGGLFAIDREYFKKIGTYDDGMDIWGGENLEISFRIWMCGGTLETTPCSHIGHIFRKRTPYKWRENVNVLLKNNLRLAEVWLDDYKHYFYERIGYQMIDYGNITSRIELRKNLQCKSFEWFLKYVYPDMWVPGEATAYGQLRAKTLPLCLQGVTDYGKTGKPLSIFDCQFGGQIWYLTMAREIRRDYGCFDFYDNKIMVEACHLMGGNQAWQFREDNTLYHENSKACLEISRDGKTLFMSPCLGTDYQIWLWNRGKPNGPIRDWNSNL